MRSGDLKLFSYYLLYVEPEHVLGFKHRHLAAQAGCVRRPLVRLHTRAGDISEPSIVEGKGIFFNLLPHKLIQTCVM